MGSGGIPNAERDVCRGYKFGLFASEYEALHEEQQRVRREPDTALKTDAFEIVDDFEAEQ